MLKCIHHKDKQQRNLMSSLANLHLQSNTKINFNGGNLSSECLGKKRLASQPTISRFGSRLEEITLEQLHEITCTLRKRIYSVIHPPRVLLDLDSTLLPTYGKQEGEAFNYHYSAHGYHPLVCYDGLTGDLLKIELRKGSTYSSTGVQKFLQPLLDEYLSQYPDTQLFLRGDSGFVTPELYTSGIQWMFLCDTAQG